MTDVVIILSMLGKFIGTVALGLAIHTLLVQPLIYFVVIRKNPFKFIYGMRDAMVTAFGVDSRYFSYCLFSSLLLKIPV